MNSDHSTCRLFPTFPQWSPIGVVVGVIFCIDLLLPLGVAAGVLYLTAVLLSLRYKNSQFSLWTAVGCSLLTIIAMFLSPVGGEYWKVVMNRGLSLFVIWTATIMGRHQLEQAKTILVRDQTIRDFMESIPSACFSFDRAGTILSWNSTAEHIYGFSKAEAVGTSMFNLFITPESHQEMKEVIIDVFQGAALESKIWSDLNKKGERGWRAGKHFPVFNSPNTVSYGVSIHTDITLQKNLSLELQQTNVLFEAMLYSSNDIIYAKDQEGKYLFANQAAKDVLESPFEAIIGKTDSEFSGTATRLLGAQFNDIVFTHGQPLRFEEQLSVKGHNRIFSTAQSPLADPQGKVIGLLGISRDITEEKLSEKDLLLTDRVFMNSPDHISILGRDYRYKRVNTTYQRMYKKFSHEIVGQSVGELLGNEIFEQTLKPKLERCFQGEEVHYEAWFTFTDNQQRFMTVSYLPLTREDGIVQEIVVIARDLTVRKQMEEALDASERQLRTILDAMTNFVGIGTMDGIVEDCNQAPLTLAGLSREDVIGKPFVDTYWLNYSSEVQEQVRQIIYRVNQGEIVREDVQVRMGEDLFITVDACYIPVLDSKRQVVQIVHSGTDVTAKRAAEEALQAREKQFRSLVQSAPFCIHDIDLDGRILTMNTTGQNMIGIEKETDIIGRSYLDLVEDHDIQRVQEYFDKACQGQTIEFEFQVTTKETPKHYRKSFTPVRDAKDTIISVMGIAEDISERKNAEEKIIQSQKRLRTILDSMMCFCWNLGS